MYKKETLKNSLKVITSNMPHMESVSIGVWIGAGGRYESKRFCGMSHFIEHMLFKGTASRTANMLKEAIEGVGGSFNGFTAEEATCYLTKLPSGYMERGLDILSDMVLNPKLDPTELEREKSVICEEIKMYMDQPAQRIFDILAETMWPNHALGRPIIGYIDSVKMFKREDLINFKNRYYQPANMSLVIAGRVDRKKCLQFAENIFSEPSAKRKFSYEEVKEVHKKRTVRLFHKDTEQTHVTFGFYGIPRMHKLRYVVEILSIILGGNMSSRLFDRLRDKKGLCYDISSGAKKYKETGTFIIHAGVDNNKLLEASREIIHELEDIKKNFVTRDELYRAKEYYRGQLLLTLEDTASRMLWVGGKIMCEGKAPGIKEIFKNIEHINIEEIKRAANIIFNKKNLNFATIGPAGDNVRKKLQEVLVL